MSELYFPQPPMNAGEMSTEELGMWFYQELQTLSQVLMSNETSRNFQELALEPPKFQEGTVVFFGPSAVGVVTNVTAPGLHIRRNNLWRRLVEAS